MGLSAINGGAIALRLEGVENVAYVRERVQLPLIGLTKTKSVPEDELLSTVYITPTFEDAFALAEAGCDIIALDCTERKRPGGQTVAQIIERIHSQLNRPVWADVATFDEGMSAAKAGADIISTTLSGYTAETAKKSDGPDFELLEALCREVTQPVILEGKVWNPAEVTEAFHRGAYAVVVGSAITRPQLITARFVSAIP